MAASLNFFLDVLFEFLDLWNSHVADRLLVDVWACGDTVIEDLGCSFPREDRGRGGDLENKIRSF
jgi:hypothetical protein